MPTPAVDVPLAAAAVVTAVATTKPALVIVPIVLEFSFVAIYPQDVACFYN